MRHRVDGFREAATKGDGVKSNGVKSNFREND